MDYSDIRTAHESYQATSTKLKERIIEEGKAFNALTLKEKELHEEHFSKVMSDDMSVGAFEKILKHACFQEIVDYKKCTKLKVLAKQEEREAEQYLNVVKKLKDV